MKKPRGYPLYNTRYHERHKTIARRRREKEWQIYWLKHLFSNIGRLMMTVNSTVTHCHLHNFVLSQDNKNNA